MRLEEGRQVAEAFVFVKEENMRMRYRPRRETPVEVRSHSDRDHPNRIVYAEGIDYVVDAENRVIRRTEESRIPDWSRHALYGIQVFDHALFPQCGNRDYTVYADYECDPDGQCESNIACGSGIRCGLERWTAKLQAGEETLIVVYGDSISAGGDASEEKFAFSHRFVRYVNAMYPDSRVALENKAKGGETSGGGRERIETDVIPLLPDVVTIGYGMNDQNLYEEGIDTPLPDFERNYRHMIEAVQQAGDCEIVLVTPCSPNPLWRYSSGWIGEYADVIRRLGSEYGAGVADVHTLWEQELEAGKTPESLLLNNINHPNDYGHLLYFKAFQLLLSSK